MAQAERIYRHLRRAIMTCELQPGERLKVMEISATEGVSPGAVREALSRLTTDHLVQSLHQRGFRVSALSKSDMLDLFATRASIESDLASRSVLERDPAWAEQLASTYDALAAQGTRPTVDDHAAIVHENFHRALVAGCRSPWSLRLFETVYAASERYRYFAFRHLAGRRKVADEHGAIYEAAIGGDAPLTKDLIFKHTMLTRELLSEGLGHSELAAV
jgi:DNA-binding GntR family transcriptional regulator